MNTQHVIPPTMIALIAGLSAPAFALEEDDKSGGVILRQDEDEASFAEPEEPLPTYDSFWQGWEASFEFGLNGSTGNTEELDVIGKFDARRESAQDLTRFRAGFEYGTEDGDTTDNEYFAFGRYDYKLEDPRWRVYFRGKYEYDEFEDWRQRIQFGPGLAYQALSTEKTELILSAGVQLIKEIGSNDNAWHLEGVLGFDLTHQLTERQQLGWEFDFFPRLDEFGPYRFETDAYWRIDMDPEAGLYLRLGIHDEYDSSPEAGFKRNDLDYYATVGWSF